MTIKTETIDVELKEGGESLRFRIQPFSATRGEAWILRAFLLLARAGNKFPDNLDLPSMGKFIMSPQGIAALGCTPYEEAEPLLDELLGCCTRLLNNNSTQPVTRSTVDGYIKSPLTLLKLRMEALKVNFSFLGDGLPSNSPASSVTEAKAQLRKSRPTSTSHP